MNKFYRTPAAGLSAVILIACYSAPLSADQIVSISRSNAFIAPGEATSITASYAISASTTTTETGLGLRLHYNSQALDPISQQLFESGAQPISPPYDDIENFDQDQKTDKFIVFSWLDNNAQWPGTQPLPMSLFTADFSVKSTFSGSSYLRLSASSTAKNTPFQATPSMLCAKPTLSVTAAPVSVNEETTDSAAFQIHADSTLPPGCGEIEVRYQLSGSAELGQDFTIDTGSLMLNENTAQLTLPVTILDDEQLEDDETLTLILLPDNTYQLDATPQASMTITSDDPPPVLPEVNLSISKTSVVEGSGGSILLYAQRTPTNLSKALPVFLSFTGTLAIGSDTLASPDAITIPAGAQQAFAVLVITDDADDEAEEQLTIRIAEHPSYQTGASAAVQLLIQDDEYTQHTNLPLADAAIPAPATVTQVEIPTLGEWVLLLLSFLMAMTAVLRIGPLDLAGGKS